MNKTFHVWFDDLLGDPTTRPSDITVIEDDIHSAARVAAEYRETQNRCSTSGDLLVYNVSDDNWHEILMRNDGWVIDYSRLHTTNPAKKRTA